jgi:hypothetical protein
MERIRMGDAVGWMRVRIGTTMDTPPGGRLSLRTTVN